MNRPLARLRVESEGRSRTRRKLRSRCTALGGGLVGRGVEQPRERALLAELCGDEAPVRLLAVDSALKLGTEPRGFGDHDWYVTGVGGEDLYTLDEPEVWSTGLCGEAPQRIAEGVRYPQVIDRWPDM